MLWGCANPPVSPAPEGIRTATAPPAPARTDPDPLQEIEILRATPVAALTPDQAIDARHVGERVRWAGAVHHMTRSEKGACLTLIHALSGDHGEPRWTPEPTYQTFEACTAGAYDPELVHESANVTIIGRVSGKTYIGMGGGGSVGPVIEIEKLYRWSDCLAGDASPVCKAGFLTPKP